MSLPETFPEETTAWTSPFRRLSKWALVVIALLALGCAFVVFVVMQEMPREADRQASTAVRLRFQDFVQTNSVGIGNCTIVSSPLRGSTKIFIIGMLPARAQVELKSFATQLAEAFKRPVVLVFRDGAPKQDQIAKRLVRKVSASRLTVTNKP